MKQQKVAKEVDEEKVIYRGEKIYYEVSVGNKDYESLKLNTEVVGKVYNTEMVSKTTPPTRWMRWRDVRPGKKQFEFDMNPDDMVFFDEVHTDPVEDQIGASVDKAARAKVDVAARRAREDMEARVNTEAISSFYVQKPV